VDAIDWVERIPFSETRNYVQRVLENLHVYRVRFGSEATAVSKAAPHTTKSQEANSTPPVLAPASAGP
jgi:soluble lytic murein transglycosylase